MKPAPDARPLAYSYLRYSSPAQQDGDSVRRQTALRESWLKRNPHVRLDPRKFTDEGVSGLGGRHRTDSRYALASFLDLVKRGDIPAGSYLIVENLDRLTRESPVDAIPAVLGLIKSGIRVVQLAPTELVYDAEMDQGKLMMMLWELSRGHGESKRKSGLLTEVWNEKKVQARAARVPHGHAVPAWLELRDGKYHVKPEAGRAVKAIFRLSAGGLGTWGIVRQLNADGVPSFGKGGKWSRAYVALILRNPAVRGVYQPMTGRPKRKPDGDPIEGYFPAVVTQKEWDLARQAIGLRQRKSGRPARGGTNVFAGLLRDARAGVPVHVITRRIGGGRLKRALVSSAAVEGEAEWKQFPYDVFTAALFRKMRELKATDLFADPGAERLEELTAEVARFDTLLATATAKFEADPESQHWQSLVSKYDQKRRAAAKALAEERQKGSSPASATWAEAVELMARDEPDRLRRALLATVEKIHCVFARSGATQVAAVQVVFRETGRVRHYVMACRPWAGTPEARPWEVQSFAEAGLSVGIDLKKPAGVKKVEAVLVRLAAAL